MKTRTMFDYAEVLATLQQVAPEAHIAGGAVRDTLLNRPIADVDVFMGDGHVEEAAALLRSARGYVKVGENLELFAPTMVRAIELERADEVISINIVGLVPGIATPEDNIAHFDFGACRVAFDGKRTVRTAQFNWDAANRTFTLHRADSLEQFDCSMARFKKIIAGRYEGWALEIPKRFEGLAKQYAFHQHWQQVNKGLFEPPVLSPRERAIA